MYEKGLSRKNNPLHCQKHRLVEIVVVVEKYKSLADFFSEIRKSIYLLFC